MYVDPKSGKATVFDHISADRPIPVIEITGQELEGLRVELTSLITAQQTLRIEVREPTVIIGG